MLIMLSSWEWGFNKFPAGAAHVFCRGLYLYRGFFAEDALKGRVYE
jgi:hypothetical protein